MHQLLQQKRQQQGWQHARSQILQQMLRDETAPHELLTSVLQQLQQFRSGFHPLLLLDRRGELPLLIHIDLSAAGWSDMQQRIAVFDNDCDIPGLNLLRVPQLGNPSPEFTGVAAGLAAVFVPFHCKAIAARSPVYCWSGNSPNSVRRIMNYSAMLAR